MIVLHHCVPTKDLFQIFRMDLEFFLDGDLLGSSGEEMVKITLGAGRIRQPLHEEIMGPYKSNRIDQLFHETHPVLRRKLDAGYGLAVANGYLAERYRMDLALAQQVQPWAMATKFEKVQEERRIAALAAQQKAYLENLRRQGQNALPVPGFDNIPQEGFLELPEQRCFQKLSRRGPTPRSRKYEKHVRRLGQMSLFEDGFEDGCLSG